MAWNQIIEPEARVLVILDFLNIIPQSEWLKQ